MKFDEVMVEYVVDVVCLFKLLFYEKWLLIFCMLVEGEMIVGEINVRVLGSQLVILQYLVVLCCDDLVQICCDVQMIYYFLWGVWVVCIIEVLYDLFCGQVVNVVVGLKNLQCIFFIGMLCWFSRVWMWCSMGFGLYRQQWVLFMLSVLSSVLLIRLLLW